MDFNAFDQKFKDKLSSLEVPYEEASWELLSNRMNRLKDLEGDSPSDGIFQHKLANLEVNYKPEDWMVMATKLDRANRVRRRMLFIKFAEAAIFLLLIANIPFMTNGNAGSGSRNKTVEKMADRLEKTGKGRSKSGFSSLQSSIPTASADLSVGALGLLNSFASQAVDQAKYEGGDVSATNPTDAQNSAIPAASNVANLLDPSVFYNTQGAVDFNELLMLPAKNREIIAFDHEDLKIPVFVAKTVSHSPWYASSYISFNRDRYQPSADAKVDKNTGGGFAVGVRNKKWGIETGLAYAVKTFSPKKQVEIYAGSAGTGYYGSYASEASAEIVSIPVKVSRKLARIGKASVHAVGGLTANISTQKEFRYKTVFYPGLQPQTDPNAGGAKPQLRKAGDGLLENGGLADNSYATADIGLRIERPIGKKYVAFVEPSLKSGIGNDAFGPSETKINSFSVQAGIMGSL